MEENKYITSNLQYVQANPAIKEMKVTRASGAQLVDEGRPVSVDQKEKWAISDSQVATDCQDTSDVKGHVVISDFSVLRDRKVSTWMTMRRF